MGGQSMLLCCRVRMSLGAYASRGYVISVQSTISVPLHFYYAPSSEVLNRNGSCIFQVFYIILFYLNTPWANLYHHPVA